jgi:hypothetical protein
VPLFLKRRRDWTPGALDLLIELYCRCVLRGGGALAPGCEPAWLTDAGEVHLGFGRMVTLCDRSSTSYQIHEEIRCPIF